jgi:hypothetical protein
MDWDNARVFLAIYRRGTLRSATQARITSRPSGSKALGTQR